jgi:membrane dipeptidase
MSAAHDGRHCAATCNGSPSLKTRQDEPVNDVLLSRRTFTKITAAALAPGTTRHFLRHTGEVNPLRWPGYDNAIVIDALASPGPFNVPDRIGSPLSDAMLDHVQSSGITAVNVTVSGLGSHHAAFDETMVHIAYWEREVSDHADVLTKVQSVSDLEAAKASSRLGLIYGFQDTGLLEGQLERLHTFYNLGVRIVQLTYNDRNQVGDGCLEEANAGLSRFGRDVVETMNELGMLIDLSHCGYRTTAEAIQLSSVPVAVTHSGCNAIFQHPRNKNDTELRGLAERGGVFGVYMMPFLNAEGPPQESHFLRHVEHALQVCGEDHVGIGSDNSITPTVADDAYMTTLFAFADERARMGIGAPREHEVLFVDGLNHPRRMETIADVLLGRGFSERVVEKVLGGNFKRLFGEVWGA